MSTIYHRTATNWFNNGFGIEDRPISCQMLFINRIYGNERSDNWLRRFSHLVRHNILFLTPKWKWVCHIQPITRADFVPAKVFRSRSMNTRAADGVCDSEFTNKLERKTHCRPYRTSHSSCIRVFCWGRVRKNEFIFSVRQRESTDKNKAEAVVFRHGIITLIFVLRWRDSRGFTGSANLH